MLYKVILDDGTDTITVVIYNNRYAYDAFAMNETYRLFGRATGGFVRKEMNSPLVIKADEKCLIRPKYALTEGLTAQMLIINMTQALESVSEQIEEPLPDLSARNSSFAPRNTPTATYIFPNPCTVRRYHGGDWALMSCLPCSADWGLCAAYPTR